MLRSALCIAAVVVSALAAPAVADECTGRLDALEAALAAAGLERADTSPGQWTARDGAVVVVVPDSGVAPRENWFGDPASGGESWALLDDARNLDQNGDEARCMARVQELEALLQALAE